MMMTITKQNKKTNIVAYIDRNILLTLHSCWSGGTVDRLLWVIKGHRFLPAALLFPDAMLSITKAAFLSFLCYRP